MTYIINEDILKKYNISIQEFLLLLFFYKDGCLETVVDSIYQKGLGDRNLINKYEPILGMKKKEYISNILMDSIPIEYSDEYFEEIATSLRELFPTGKKEGTSCMWRDSVITISKRLKLLVTKYKCKFTKEEAINAAKRYIESFNGDYTYMQVLKYFLIKSDKQTGDIRSEFMSYLENKEDTDHNKDWSITLK